MNSQDHSTIERCPHDAQNPYAQISRNLIRDASISPECRWLLIYLLSNSDGWSIKPKQIYAHLKGFIGKDKVYDLLNEGVDAGYIKRESYIEKNLKRYRYYLSETPKFKKSFRCPGFQDTGRQDTENTDTLKKEHPKKDNIKEAAALTRTREKTPPPQKELTPKEKLRKEIGSSLTDEQFERGYQIYESREKKASVKNPAAWIIASVKSSYLNKREAEERNKHVATWQLMEWKPKGGGVVEIGKEGVEFSHGTYFMLIRYDSVRFLEELQDIMKKWE